MTIHISGSDLANVYAAALGVVGPGPSPAARMREAADTVMHFLDTLESIDGVKPQVGDPSVWEVEPDSLPRRYIGRDSG